MPRSPTKADLPQVNHLWDTGDSHTCLEHLTEAIRQNPKNRIQARGDSDFQDMADDPRFTELLYPEV